MLFGAWSGTMGYKWEQHHSFLSGVLQFCGSTAMLGGLAAVSADCCRQSKWASLDLCGVTYLSTRQHGATDKQYLKAVGGSGCWLRASAGFLPLNPWDWQGSPISASLKLSKGLCHSWCIILFFYKHGFPVSAGSDSPLLSPFFKLCCWVK